MAGSKWLLLAAALCLAAAVRWFHLGTESVWLDEATSISIAHDPVPDVIDDTAQDVHPPLYYLLLHVWMRAAGDSERAVRSLSAVLSLTTVVAVVAFARRWFDERTAIVAAALLAVSPMQIAVAQEARMYALLTLTAMLSTHALLSVVKSGTSRACLAYVLATAAMLYTHAYAGFVVAGQGIWLVGALVSSPAHRRQWWRRGFLAFGLAAVAYLPWLPTFLAQLRGVEHAFWIPPSATIGAAMKAQAGSLALAVTLGLLSLFAVTTAMLPAGAREERGEWTGAAVGLSAAVVVAVIGVPFALSRFSSPIFLPKYTVAASAPFLLLAAHGVARLPRQWLRALVVMAVLAMTVAPLRTYFGNAHRDDWRRVVALIDHDGQPGDLVLFSQAFGVLPFEYYARRSDLVRLPFLDEHEGLTTRSLDVLADVAVAPYDRVWLVVSDPDVVTRALRKRLARETAVVDQSGGGVAVTLFVRGHTTRR